MRRFKLKLGNCLDILPTIKENGIDAVVCDPPYGLSFMGREWDHGVPGKIFWEQTLRVAKPGAHLLAFGGTRTHHRLMVAIEDAGWEIRDCLMWVFGSGMPKGQDISKAIDRQAGQENVIGYKYDRWTGKGNSFNFATDRPQAQSKVTAPATDAAKQWEGWNTQLKPAWEPIILARKPISESTVAANVLEWGTGAINADSCRIEANSRPLRVLDAKNTQNNTYAGRMDNSLMGGSKAVGSTDLGRWPANVIHDGSDDATSSFPTTYSPQPGIRKSDGFNNGIYDKGMGIKAGQPNGEYGDSGSAARYFYCAKASKSDRGENNSHPTVKPTSLMRYLCKLVTPPNGIVLDPFMGSGSTGKAALLEGFLFYGIELDEKYFEIASERIQKVYEEVAYATPNS